MKKIDPVCGMEVDESTAAASSEYRGEKYFFCAVGCKNRFDKDPESFLHGGTDHPVTADLSLAVSLPEASVHPPSRMDEPSDRSGVTGKLSFRIGGMTCASCVRRIENSLRVLPGVTRAAVNLTTETGTVEFRPGTVDVDNIREAVSSSGYTVTIMDGKGSAAGGDLDALRKDLIISVLLTLPIFVLNMFFSDASPIVNYLLIVLTLPVLFWCGRRFFRGFLSTLLHFSADMNTLVSIGTLSAFGYSTFATFFPEKLLSIGQLPVTFFDTSAVIITLVLTGRYLESGSKRKASDALQALRSLAPETASLVTGDEERVVPVGSLQPGDVIRVRPGGQIAADGRIIEGSSSADQSGITGESLPVELAAGDEVFGGTLNLDGTLLIEVTQVARDSLLGQIINSVEETELGKVPIQRLADRIASWFVPAVIFIAVCTFIYWYYLIPDSSLAGALLSFVSVLIVACPCALGLATPTAIVVGKGIAAREGIIIKNIEKLELAHGIDTILLDKTGTITTGNIAVSAVYPMENEDQSEILLIAASAEKYSEHPIARAIVQAAVEKGLKLREASGFRNRPGVGVEVTIDESEVKIISPKELSHDYSTDIRFNSVLEKVKENGETAVCVVQEGRATGLISLTDTIKPQSVKAVAGFRKMGMKTIMITGDNAGAAERIGKEAGIDEIHANLLPHEKALIVTDFQSKGMKVCMAGDGINDAPALAQADLGIAVGSGTDLARYAGDITIISDDPVKIQRSLEISRDTMRVIHQNLFWAFIYNVALIPMAASGTLDPMFAAAAMAFSSLSVVGNSLRLKRKTGS